MRLMQLINVKRIEKSEHAHKKIIKNQNKKNLRFFHLALVLLLLVLCLCSHSRIHTVVNELAMHKLLILSICHR